MGFGFGYLQVKVKFKLSSQEHGLSEGRHRQLSIISLHRQQNRSRSVLISSAPSSSFRSLLLHSLPFP